MLYQDGIVKRIDVDLTFSCSLGYLPEVILILAIGMKGVKTKS